MSDLLPVEDHSLGQRGRAVHPIKWKAKFGGMQVSDARKLKALEEENRKLKKLLAESMLDAATLKELLGKNF
jgi:putative transposase